MDLTLIIVQNFERLALGGTGSGYSRILGGVQAMDATITNKLEHGHLLSLPSAYSAR